MADKDKRCWYCGQNTMELYTNLGHGWLKCSNCGATCNPNPTKKRPSADMDTWFDENGIRHYHPIGVHVP